MAKRSNEPLLWSLFSAGGVVAAFLIPILLFLYGIVFPLGLIDWPGYQETLELVRHPLTKRVLFVLCSLPLFHWAHRFRFTLYDGLQIKHLNEVIAVLCYGGALIGTVLAGYILWKLP
jgi:succinate dehydrogenase subunit D